MTIRLQEFGFRESPYERPTQKWVCGWAAEGRACALGPDRKGRCGATFECVPLQKGDRWHCTRPETSGGSCPEGPLPDGACSRAIPRCLPVLSLRARRGLVTLWTAIGILAGVLLLFAGPSGPDFISPGELGAQHATAIGGCAACHEPARTGRAGWVASAFTFRSAGNQSHLCLQCHDLGEHPLKAHGISPEALTGISRWARQSARSSASPWILSLASVIPGAGAESGRNLACATCHPEHRGKRFPLADLDNLQCQACHFLRFESLAKGHPEFSDYPPPGRARLLFSHTSHIGKHFRGEAKEHAPSTCTGCHVPDLNGESMLGRGFETSCAKCHAAQIEGEGRAGAKGIPFLRVPGLDLRTLKARGVGIGEWPEDAEETSTPFMDLLLSGDQDLKADRITVAHLDLMDLPKASNSELRSVERYAWAIKELFFDLSTTGHPALRSRLEKTAGRRFRNPEMASLVGQLPADVVRTAQQAWLPALMAEIPLHRNGSRLPTKTSPPVPLRSTPAADQKPSPATGTPNEGDLLAGNEGDLLAGVKEAPKRPSPQAASEKALGPETSPEERVSAGGWFRDDLTFSLLYRPGGHADAFLRSWIELTAGVGDAHQNGAAGAIFSMLSDPKAPGLCAKCHSTEPPSGTEASIQWTSSLLRPTERHLTRFAHTPHFSLLDQSGCQPCHFLKRDDDASPSSRDANGDGPANDFDAMSKRLCADCHKPEGAGDHCLTCHNYHAGSARPPAVERAGRRAAGIASEDFPD